MSVRRQGFWNQWQLKLRESLPHLVGFIRCLERHYLLTFLKKTVLIFVSTPLLVVWRVQALHNPARSK
jgi:hypothetical protein